MNKPEKIYFFGCGNRGVGHYLWEPCANGGMRDVYFDPVMFPWGFKIDSGLAPPGPGSTRDRREEIQGHAALHHDGGWTALSWWDRSIDDRGACNAAIIAKGTFTFDEMIEIMRTTFPRVISRFRYTISEDPYKCAYTS